MRDLKHMDKDIVEKISNQAWRCVDLLYQSGRGDSTNLVLLLISAYKDDVFSTLQNIKSDNWFEDYLKESQVSHQINFT